MPRTWSWTAWTCLLCLACVDEPGDLGPSQTPTEMDDGNDDPITPPSEDAAQRLTGFPAELRLIDLDPRRGKLLVWPGERRLAEVDLMTGTTVVLTESAALYAPDEPERHRFRRGLGGPWGARFTESGGVVYFEGEPFGAGALDRESEAVDSVVVVRTSDARTQRFSTRVGFEPSGMGVSSVAYAFDASRPDRPSQLLLREAETDRLVDLETLELRRFDAVEPTDRPLWVEGARIQPGFTTEAPFWRPRLEGEALEPTVYVGPDGGREALPFLEPEASDADSWSSQVWCDASDGALRRLDLAAGEVRNAATLQGVSLRGLIAVGSHCHGRFAQSDFSFPRPREQHFILSLSADGLREARLPSTSPLEGYTLSPVGSDLLMVAGGEDFRALMVEDHLFPYEPSSFSNWTDGVAFGSTSAGLFDLSSGTLARVDADGLEVIRETPSRGNCPIAPIGALLEAWDRRVSTVGQPVLSRGGQAMVCEPDEKVENAWRLSRVDLGRGETVELTTREPLSLWSDASSEGRAIFVDEMAVIAARAADGQTELTIFRF